MIEIMTGELNASAWARRTRDFFLEIKKPTKT